MQIGSSISLASYICSCSPLHFQDIHSKFFHSWREQLFRIFFNRLNVEDLPLIMCINSIQKSLIRDFFLIKLSSRFPAFLNKYFHLNHQWSDPTGYYWKYSYLDTHRQDTQEHVYLPSAEESWHINILYHGRARVIIDWYYVNTKEILWSILHNLSLSILWC